MTLRQSGEGDGQSQRTVLDLDAHEFKNQFPRAGDVVHWRVLAGVHGALDLSPSTTWIGHRDACLHLGSRSGARGSKVQSHPQPH